MCQYSMEIYFNIALVPAFRDALYLVEERSKEIRTADRWEKERDRKSEGERYLGRIRFYENSRSKWEIFEDRAGGDEGNICEYLKSNCTRPGLLDLFDISTSDF